MANEMLLKDLGERIKQRRKQMGITQEKLAEAMDVSIQMISNLEQGKKAIRPENLVKLCNVLRISADFLLTGRYAPVVSDGILEKYNRLSPECKQLIHEIVDKFNS